jgi:hypothetical protein
MHSPGLLRVIIEEREREIQTRVRVRRLLGSRRPAIRWHAQMPRPLPGSEGR